MKIHQSHPNVDKEDYMGTDAPALIQICLSCERGSCNNCLAAMNKKKQESLIFETEQRGLLRLYPAAAVQ